MPLATVNGELVEVEPGYWRTLGSDRAEQLARKHNPERWWDDDEGFDTDSDFDEE